MNIAQKKIAKCIHLSLVNDGMDLTQWMERNSNREAVSQIKCTLRNAGIGLGVDNLNRVNSGAIIFPSTSNVASSSSSTSSETTVRATVSIAREMRDFSLAASTAEDDASRVLLLLEEREREVEAWSPLTEEPFSVEDERRSSSWLLPRGRTRGEGAAVVTGSWVRAVRGADVANRVSVDRELRTVIKAL